MFKHKAGTEPEGGKIKADDTIDIPWTAAVIPRTEFVFFEQSAADIFYEEDEIHIRQAAYPGIFPLKQSADGGQNGGEAIDGKHPEGSTAHEGHISPAQGIYGSKNDFHAPACQAAFEKVFDEGNDIVFHENAPLGVLFAE